LKGGESTRAQGAGKERKKNLVFGKGRLFRIPERDKKKNKQLEKDSGGPPDIESKARKEIKKGGQKKARSREKGQSSEGNGEIFFKG